MSKEFKRVHEGDRIGNIRRKGKISIHTKESADAVNKFREEVVLGRREKSMEEHLVSKTGKPSDNIKTMRKRIGKLRKLFKPTYPGKELPTILKR